jgi:hypothetical protein
MNARIHWARIALAAYVTLAATAANAQESIHPKKIVDPEAGLPGYKRKYMPPDGSLDWLPDGARIVATIKPSPPEPLGSANPLAGLLPAPLPIRPAPPEPVVMYGGMGGVIWEHQSRFNLLAARGQPVEMRGGCWSACTLITGYVPKDRLCFAAGSFLAFHAAVTAAVPHRLSVPDTWTMYFALPAQIQNWIDANGGPLKMTVADYWFLRDVDLWKMGYPRCK